MDALRYEPGVIAEYAARLYARGRSIVASYTLLGVLLGPALLILGSSVWASSMHTDISMGMGELGIAALVGAFVGYRLGSEKAFWLRLQAQKALCQMEIEANTRLAAKQLGTLASPSAALHAHRPIPDAQIPTAFDRL